MAACLDWEECLESLLSTLDQVALRVKENKSAVGFTKKYLASLNPRTAEACVRSIHLADSASTRGMEGRTESLIDILDSLPFIVSTVEDITRGSRIEPTLAATCFLLTKAMLGHETMLHNASYLDSSSSDYETRHAYQRYRSGPEVAAGRTAAYIRSSEQCFRG